LNLPATSIRDLIVKDDDLVAATHSRGFWILDDVTPLRQITRAVADAGAFLFRPETAIRVRWDMNTDTPLPPDEPAGQNPPDGAMLDYVLGAGASGTVTLEILDSGGKLVRRYSSDDPVEPIDPTLAIPAYWIRSPHPLANAPGMHRFLWDLHYTPVGERHNYPMQAIVHETAPANGAPWVMPGSYTVKLTVNGQSYTQPLAVKMDPRVHTPLAGLAQQFGVSKQLYDGVREAAKSREEAVALRKQIAELKGRAGALADVLETFDKKIAALAGAGGGRGFGRFGGGGADTLAGLEGGMQGLLGLVQGADVPPTPQAVAAAEDRRKALAAVIEKWRALKPEMAALNAQLKQAGLREIQP